MKLMRIVSQWMLLIDWDVETLETKEIHFIFFGQSFTLEFNYSSVHPCRENQPGGAFAHEHELGDVNERIPINIKLWSKKVLGNHCSGLWQSCIDDVSIHPTWIAGPRGWCYELLLYLLWPQLLLCFAILYGASFSSSS